MDLKQSFYKRGKHATMEVNDKIFSSVPKTNNVKTDK